MSEQEIKASELFELTLGGYVIDIASLTHFHLREGRETIEDKPPYSGLVPILITHITMNMTQEVRNLLGCEFLRHGVSVRYVKRNPVKGDLVFEGTALIVRNVEGDKCYVAFMRACGVAAT